MMSQTPRNIKNRERCKNGGVENDSVGWAAKGARNMHQIEIGYMSNTNVELNIHI